MASVAQQLGRSAFIGMKRGYKPYAHIDPTTCMDLTNCNMRADGVVQIALTQRWGKRGFWFLLDSSLKKAK